MRYYKTIQIDKKQVRLHRYIMQQHIGRKLKSSELVHHKNGNIFDNTIKNLQIVTRADHKKLHPEIGLKSRFKTKHKISISIIKKMYKTQSIQKIATHFNVAIGTIYNKMKKNNISTNKRGHKFKQL